MKIEDFIIWDKLNNHFLDCDLVHGIVFCNSKFSYVSRRGAMHNDLFAEEVEFFSYVGIDDIDSKKIYAESSIVEFDCKIYGGYFEKPKGVFFFNNISLRYCLKSLRDGKTIPYDIDYISNIKIIDTIQENKLGLIK